MGAVVAAFVVAETMLIAIAAYMYLGVPGSLSVSLTFSLEVVMKVALEECICGGDKAPATGHVEIPGTLHS